MFRILALSGGGFKGLFTARVLAKIEERSGCLLADRFELIAGTSIGAIIALAAAARVPMKQVVDLLCEDGPKIFPQRPKIISLFFKATGLTRPLYSAVELRKLLSILYAQKKIGDLDGLIVIPAVNLTTGSPKVFKTPHHINFFRDRHFSLVDVALASSAAPVYFPLAAVANENFADGGLFATAPDFIASHEAEVWLNVPSSEINILSVGTLSSRFSIPHSAGREFGLLDWISNDRLLEAVFSSQQKSVEFIMRQRFPQRYHRIDITPGHEVSSEMGLDVANSAIQLTMMGLADDLAGAALNDDFVKSLLVQPAKRYEMFNG